MVHEVCNICRVTDEFLVDLAEIARAPAPAARVGGKAASLGRLIAAGLPVPPGVVLGPGAAVAAQRLAHLQAPLVVRSSAAIEDGPGGAAAGLFESVRDVMRDQVAEAIEAVRASADTPAARAYAAVRGVDRVEMAVIVQEQAHGEAGVLYTRAPGAPRSPAMVFEYGGIDVALDRAGDLTDAATELGLPLQVLEVVRTAGLAAERAIHAGDGADIELVVAGDALWIVQARPIVHPRTMATPPPPSIIAAAPPGRWRWDVTHNPLRLSPAQASLVARANALGAASHRMAVIGGYLYYPVEGEDPGAKTELGPGRELDAARVSSVWQRELMPALEWAVAPVRGQPAPPLAAALRAFDEVHAIYVGPLATLLRDADTALQRAGAEAAPPGAAGVSAWIARAARGEVDAARALEVLGDVSLEWDVAAPTFREQPAQLEAAIEAWRERARAPAIDTLAAAVHRVREEDDLYYFAVQAAVRRALLACARARRLADPHDIFFVGVDQALTLTHDALVGRADRALVAHERATGWSMPLVIRDGRAVYQPARAGAVWRGTGTGGRVSGVAHVLDPAPRRAVAGSIVIARSIAPATVVLLASAAALVTEHGGLLGHAASIARELDIPCVVGCTGITEQLRTGDRVLVDGSAGLVARLSD